jgi:nicotinate-nucleotide adenylyltransferase
MKRYGIIGGTFDPIHYAHLYIAYEAKEQLNLDEVIFMPAGKQPLKADKIVTDSKIRYDMVKSAIETYDSFSISDYEIKKGGLSFTYETLENFKNNNNEDTELFFITGADCLLTLEEWKSVEKIFSLATLVVFPRGGISKVEMTERKQSIEKKYNGKIIILDLKELEISSTYIRERVNKNQRIDFFVPSNIIDIIYKNDLYIDK